MRLGISGRCSIFSSSCFSAFSKYCSKTFNEKNSRKFQEAKEFAACQQLFTWHLQCIRYYKLEKEMATHSTVLARRIPGTGEPGGLSSMGSHRVGHD